MSTAAAGTGRVWSWWRPKGQGGSTGPGRPTTGKPPKTKPPKGGRPPKPKRAPSGPPPSVLLLVLRHP
ncbi:MAG TPA: hypothetical protein VFM54_14705 [Micromonosporaceae bacterium]|nr:hypothetical protein [Micromonosporaceae bacterium]